jgi:hypothetical protein
MLTIPEEFLLLTMTDEGGDFIHLPTGLANAGFVGAALMDLALRNRIDSDLDRVWVVDEAASGEACVDLILERLKTPNFDFRAAYIIGQLLDWGPGVRTLALSRLCGRNILVAQEDRLLWVFKTRRYPLIGDVEIREVKTRLRAVLLDGQLPDPQDVCLLALASVCGLIHLIVPESELGRASKRLESVSRMDLIGQRVGSYLETWMQGVAISHGGAPVS